MCGSWVLCHTYFYPPILFLKSSSSDSKVYFSVFHFESSKMYLVIHVSKFFFSKLLFIILTLYTEQSIFSECCLKDL